MSLKVPTFIEDRVSFLYSIYEESLRANNPSLAHFYMYNMMKYSESNKVDLNLEGYICKYCSNTLISGITSQTRVVRNKKLGNDEILKTKGASSFDQVVVNKCNICASKNPMNGHKRKKIAPPLKQKAVAKPTLKNKAMLPKFQLLPANKLKAKVVPPKHKNKPTTKSELKNLLVGELKKAKRR